MESSNTKKILFDTQTRVAPLGLIAMNGTQELGNKDQRLSCKMGKRPRNGKRQLSDRNGLSQIFFR